MRVEVFIAYVALTLKALLGLGPAVLHVRVVLSELEGLLTVAAHPWLHGAFGLVVTILRGDGLEAAVGTFHL